MATKGNSVSHETLITKAIEAVAGIVTILFSASKHLFIRFSPLLIETPAHDFNFPCMARQRATLGP